MGFIVTPKIELRVAQYYEKPTTRDNSEEMNSIYYS